MSAMKCRNCEKELAEGSALCHHCGTVQDNYIQRRAAPKKNKARMPRTTLMSLGVIGIVVVFLLVLGPIIKNTQRQARFEEILTMVNALDRSDQLAVVSAQKAIENYFRDFPDTPEANEAKQLLETAMGWHDVKPLEVSPDPANPPTLDQTRASVENGAFSLLELSFSTFESEDGPTVSVKARWVNSAPKVIDQLQFHVRAYDDSKRIILSRTTKEEDTILKSTKRYPPMSSGDEPNQNLFMDVWHTGQMTHIELTQIYIHYEDGSELLIDGELLSHVWA